MAKQQNPNASNNVSSEELRLKQEMAELSANLDGGKTYWYKEEVQRDQRRYNELRSQLMALEEERLG